MKPDLAEKIFKYFSWACSFVLIGAIFIIISFLIIKGFRALNLNLIFSDTNPLDALLLKKPVFDGLLPAIIGTLLLIILSISFAVPLGLATGIFLAEYCPVKIKGFFSLLFDILAGIPSIVVGLFGFSLTIFLHHYFYSRLFPCLLISALSLAFLVLPYIIRTTQVALETLPLQTRLTALSLGATKLLWQAYLNLFFQILKLCLFIFIIFLPSMQIRQN
jgi:phosphate transport system permease protein